MSECLWCGYPDEKLCIELNETYFCKGPSLEFNDDFLCRIWRMEIKPDGTRKYSIMPWKCFECQSLYRFPFVTEDTEEFLYHLVENHLCQSDEESESYEDPCENLEEQLEDLELNCSSTDVSIVNN